MMGKWFLKIFLLISAVFVVAGMISAYTALGAVLFFLGMTFFVLKYFIIDPLDSLVKIANKICLGDWKQRFDRRSGGGTGGLEKVFNRMLDSIAETDKKLKEEHEEMQAIVSSMGEGLLVLDRDLNIISMNKAAEANLEISLDKCKGWNIKKIITLMKGSEEVPFEEYPGNIMLRTGKTVTINMKDNVYYKCATGKIFPVEIVTAPFIKNGVVGAIVLFKDITEIKQMEEDREYARINFESALKSVYIERNIAQEQKNKLEAILNSIGDAVFAIDQEKKIIIFNPAAEALTGFKFNKVRGRIYSKYLKFLDEVTKMEKTKHIDRALKGEVVSADRLFVLMTKKGTPIYVEERITPIKNQHDQIMGCIVVFRDITAKRKLEMMRSDFISIASHQLRTPLSAAKWFLEILINGDVGGLKRKQLEVLREAHANNQNMISLINTMLNMSRLESKQMVINIEKINLEKIIEKILSKLKPTLGEKDQKVKFFGLKDKNLEIETDGVFLKNIIDNLIVNSSKYSPSGADIVLKVVKKDPCFLLFSVADKGIGIPKREQYKIFKKFSRTDNATSYNASGTGLGLYITKSILDVLGGKIWFKSTENKGTTFYFSLPIKREYCKI